jgi:segregation and condensation protein B
MDQDKLCRLVESLLFVSDGPLELTRIQQILEIEREELDNAVATLARSYENRGIALQRKGDALQLASAPEAAPYVDKLLGVQQSVKLSTAALETLAIVAYRQPITRAAIEAIRGVNSERALGTLQARGLVCEVGRLETIGRPMLFGTTFEFLEYFGLRSLEELPPLEIVGKTTEG